MGRLIMGTNIVSMLDDLKAANGDHHSDQDRLIFAIIYCSCITYNFGGSFHLTTAVNI